MTTALMSIGTRSMFAAQASLTTTGQNIANANVDGYSRQEVKLTTSPGQFTGVGFFGKGVDIRTISREHNSFLTREAQTANAVASLDATHASQLTQLEKAFSLGGAGVGSSASQFLNSFVDLASNPADNSAREVVLSRAQDLTNQFNSLGEQLNSFQSGVNEDFRLAVSSINDLAAQIAKVNDQIASLKGSGHEPNDLLDKRDQYITELSRYVPVSTILADDGSMGVFSTGGQRLVLGTEATKLAAMADTFDPQKVALGIVDSGGAHRVPSDGVTAGVLGGLLRFQEQDLTAAKNFLGQMAAALAGGVNQQQALGLDLSQPAGPGAPMFSVPGPQVLPADTNVKDGAGNYTATLSLSTVDPFQLQASDYSLVVAPSGGYTLTRLSDGQTRTVNDGDVVDGFQVNVGSTPPAALDRFIFRPVAAASQGIKRILGDPKGIAAASPFTATLATANKGTATVNSLAAVNTTFNAKATATVTFATTTDPSTGKTNVTYTWGLADENGAPLDSGTGNWQPGAAIAINGFEMKLSGVPRNNDVITVLPTKDTRANNGNANAMVALRDLDIVGRQTLTNSSKVAGLTLTDAYAAAVGNIGVRVQSAKTAADISASASAAATTAVKDATGVNLDEEAARLIQFQQSYQASAKVLQVAQSVFDTLLRTMTG